MPRLPVEKATDYADLPHQFGGQTRADECSVCYGPEIDPRHVAWERAMMAHPSRAVLRREYGV